MDGECQASWSLCRAVFKCDSGSIAQNKDFDNVSELMTYFYSTIFFIVKMDFLFFSGYINMARNQNNKCQIATAPCYPIV